MSLLERLQAAYQRASQGDDRLATALVARFMGRMLDVVRNNNGVADAAVQPVIPFMGDADMTAFLESVGIDKWRISRIEADLYS